MSLAPADQKLIRPLGRAIRRYGLIEAGDRIAVAVSGGSDSLALLWLLRERLHWVPIRYELTAVHLDPGFGGPGLDRITAFCRELGVPLHAEITDYGPRAHGPENRENPCFLCSRLRRKRLFEIARDRSCSKLALGHNQDDMVETLFLNIFYSGEISTMLPRQSLFQGALTIIRPLALTAEREIRTWIRHKGWPEIINPCPSAGRSSRAEIKNLLQTLYASNPKIRGNTFRALSRVRPEYLPPPFPRGRRS